MSDNPLLRGLTSPLPLFAEIRPAHVLPALDAVLTQNRQELAQLLANPGNDWASLMAPLEEMEERLSRLWGPVGHLNAVCDSDELRPVYREGLQQLTLWQSELAQNETLFAAVRALHDSTAFAGLNEEQKQVVRHTLRDFRLAGAELDGAAKERFTAIRMRLSELATRFEQNLLDATRAFTLHLLDAADLDGLPESIRAGAAQRARAADLAGWLFTLDIPSYLPFMQHAKRRELREKLYTAYTTRAAEGERDNTPVIDEILALRAEAARLLGFAHYADYSLASKMAPSADEVVVFLRELALRSRPMAEAEMGELRAYARAELRIEELAAWDVAYASEQLRQKTYAISQEELKPYFAEGQVLAGLFQLVEKLYGLTVRAAEAEQKWHPDVRYFEIFDAVGAQVAAFWLDPYARAHKRGGAWMDECLIRRRRADGSLQLPVAYLVCNFEAPIGEGPALWTHDEVTTLFHEFGHGLHHMLTEIETAGVSGIRGVPWDAVELPSQFMENFCWERSVIDMIGRHHENGEQLPGPLFARMLAAKNFQSGMQMLRQIEFALFDLLLHSEFTPGGAQSVQELLDAVRREVAVLIPPPFNRFQNSFGHIFAGGYAAGYYSYKWAEVLSSDAYAAFEEAGLFDHATAAGFRRQILSIGGSRDIMAAFRDFRGRKPSIDALLRHSGIG